MTTNRSPEVVLLSVLSVLSETGSHARHAKELCKDYYKCLNSKMTERTGTWSRPPSGGRRSVRTPQDAINITIQRRSHATKDPFLQSIIAVCRTWRRLCTEFFVRCLFFDDPINLCNILDRNPSLGLWVRRLHITRFLNGRGPRMGDFEEPFIAIVRQCPNPGIFIVDWLMSLAIGPIANTPSTSCRNLRTVHWHVPSELPSKVIRVLDTFPSLVAVHIEFAAAIRNQTEVKLKPPNFQQLFLKEQAIGWSLPFLRSFSVHFDLHCIHILDVRTILDLFFPFLTTFCFNLDWKEFPHEIQTGQPGHEAILPITLTNRPHDNIRYIGLRGLLYALGVGYVPRTNDRNFKALNRTSTRVLQELNNNFGLADSYFERWWGVCTKMRVGLQNYSGAVLEDYDGKKDEYEYVMDEEVERSVSLAELRKLSTED
ncbi:hypothetical protein HD554DRAFT_2206137 [Boletus coccyginus]|nr:hypothetical protein HD554DRAFT_2206137 [Boletus coccyginus]